MTPELWEKVTDLYHEASELEGRARREFLDRECADDETLRREVESLLAANADAGDFITIPAVGTMESWSGQFVAHYQIMSRIGSGGMGEVYLARDSKLNRPVALKTLPRSMSDHPDHLRRFEIEAQTAAAMNHPNIAIVYSVEEAGRHRFLTMEYIEGKTLDHFIRPDGIDLKTFLDWFIPIADALCHAHAKGILHRDVKPGNVMITTDSTPKVLDFGLAQTVEQPGKENGGGAGQELVMGTPAYMSPEQARGVDLDFRSDIFSFGVLMYESLTGKRPFTGENHVELIAQLLRSEAEPVHKAKPDVPRELSKLIHRCLHKDPRRRVGSMEDIRDALEQIRYSRFGISTDGFDVLRAERTPTGSRNVVAYAFGGAVLLAVLGFALYYLISRPDQPVLSFSNVTQRRLSQTNDVLFTHITPDGGSYVYSTLAPNDERAIWIRRVTDNESLQLVPPGPVSFWGGFTTTRDGSHLYYISAERDARHGTLMRVSTLGGTPRKIAETVNDLGGVSPDGSRVLYVRYGPNVLLLSANAEDGSDERVIRQAEANEIFRDPQFSHDGRSIYQIRVARVNGVEHWSLEQIGLDGAHQRTILQPRKTRISEIAVLRDGSGLLVNAVDPVSNLNQIAHISLRDGSETRITNDLNSYVGLSVSDDATRVVTVQRSFFKDIWVGIGQDISSYRKVTTESAANLRVEWTPDGRLVYDAIDNNRPQIRIMNADGTGGRQLTGSSTSDFEPRLTPDGRHIVFTSMRSGERKVWRMDIDGGRPEMLTPGEGTAGAPSVSPDGENVYFVWTKSDTKSMGIVPIGGGPIVEKPLFSETYSAISPDGKRVAYAFYAEQEKRYLVGVRPIDRQEPETIFRISPTWFLCWPAGADALFYRELEPGEGSDSTVMMQPLSGGGPRPFLSVAPDQIFNFSLAPDGKRAAVIRGRMVTDAVLLSRDPER